MFAGCLFKGGKMPDNKTNIKIICGHYGTGKTNLTVNLAKNRAAAGEKVTVVDMDIVNPYFRSSDYRGILEEDGIEVIAPVFGATNLDLPSLPASMYMAFEKEGTVYFDLGGDDVGATVMGRFREKLNGREYEMYYVVNRYRDLDCNPQETVNILREIEGVTRLKATAIINNSHLMDETTSQHIKDGIEYTREVARLAGLPVIATVIRDDLAGEFEGKLPKDSGELIKAKIYVKPAFA